MLKTLLTPFGVPSTQKPTQSVTTMIVTTHDINFMMGFIKEEEIFSAAAAANATNASITSSSTLLPSKIHNVSSSILSKSRTFSFSVDLGGPK